MAASLATLDELDAVGGIEKLRTLGEMLRDGMLSQARSHAIEVTWSGPPALPYMSFEVDQGKHARNKPFCGEAAKHGINLHPRPTNWFLSAAHTEEDIKHTLGVTDDAFAAVKKQFSE